MFTRLINGRVAFLSVSVLQRGIPFILLPLFVSHFTPSEYGQVGVLTAVFTLGSMTFGLGQELVVYRYSSATNQHMVTTAAAVLVGTAFGLGTAACGVVLLAQLDLGGTPPVAVAASALGAAMYCAAWQYPAAIFRSNCQVGRYFALALTYTGSIAATKVVLVILLDLGPIGWGLADAIGSALLLGLTMPTLLPAFVKARRSITKNRVGTAVRLGFPVTISQSARWAAGFSDRIWLVLLAAPAAAGTYALAAQLVTIGNVIVLELSRYLQPRLGRLREGDSSGDIMRLAKTQLLLAVVAMAGTMILGGAVALSGFADDYGNVALMTAALALGLPLLAINYLGSDLYVVTLGRSRWLASTSITSAVLSVAGNVALIPTWGAWGAVAVTMACHLLTSTLLWIPVLRSSRRNSPAATT